MQFSYPVVAPTFQEGRDKVAPMRQKLEETDEKIKSLVKFFGAHYNNVTGILGHDEVIQVISGHFSKWNDCRAVCQRLQVSTLTLLENYVLLFIFFLPNIFLCSFTNLGPCIPAMEIGGCYE